MKLLILATALLGLSAIVPAIAGQTCVTRNGYTYCNETYGDNQNCVRQGSSSFVCH